MGSTVGSAAAPGISVETLASVFFFLAQITLWRILYSKSSLLINKLYGVNHIKSPPTEFEQRLSDQERFLSKILGMPLYVGP